MQKTCNTKFTHRSLIVVGTLLSFLNYVIVPDSLKMCYMYICTGNQNESVNKQIQIQLTSSNVVTHRYPIFMLSINFALLLTSQNP
jgi:hypothetical protein